MSSNWQSPPSHQPPTYSPPSAYPPPLPSRRTSAHPPPPHRSQQPWAQPGSFYLGGSAAPPILGHRRPNMERPPPTALTPARPSQPAPAPGALSDGQCCCCATPLRYPKGSLSYRCTICGTITDLKKPAGLAAAWGTQPAPPPVNPTPVTEDEVLHLARRLSTPASCGSADLSSQLSSLALNSTTTSDDPESLLLAYIRTAFSNLESIEKSFRPASTPLPPATSPLPTFKTITIFYDLVKARPKALNTLREHVEAILRRPGPSLLEGDGGWVVVLFECPILLSEYTSDSAQRQLILSRLVGLVSNLHNTLHYSLVAAHLCSTTPSYPRAALLAKVEMVVSFVSLRIGGTLAQRVEGYAMDWGVKAGAKVGALFFAANLQYPRLPISAFYCTLVDSLGHSAMIEAFHTWEKRDERFTLCQYPFLLSLGVKIHLLTFDGQRQMLEKAREAYHSTVYHRTLEAPLLLLTIRRTNLVQNSLQQISENRAHLKKSLKISFEGEDGIDAGGLRKEWFLLLCRQLFDPQWGMFKHDADSNLCWFNSASSDTDEFYLLGATVGLAIYNSVTLDVPLPLAVYKKLLNEPVSLADLARVQPQLARGLQSLLDFEGDVEDVFCRTFVGELEAWGEVQEIPLIEGGENVMVTNENRQDFVRRLVNFILNTSVSAQFEAFARGFAQVTAGNSLSLFKGEELELLVRGSAEPLDIEDLKGVTVYEGFTGLHDPTVQLFWAVFAAMNAVRQRQLLSFITSSDRIPATGTTALQLKLTCVGDDTINQLCLYRYRDRETMEERLTRAMDESEGFGLK